MTVTAPETAARLRLIGILQTEFTGLDVRSDKLNESQGQDSDIGAVYPSNAMENPRDGLVLDTTVYVQLFRKWDNRLDAKQVVDPAAIEEWAERLRRACQADLATPGDEHVWYFRVVRVDYPPDPSGNISRLLATVAVDSQNPALVETAD